MSNRRKIQAKDPLDIIREFYQSQVKELEVTEREAADIDRRRKALQAMLDAVDGLGDDAWDESRNDERVACIQAELRKLTRKDCVYVCKILGISMDDVSYNSTIILEDLALVISGKLVSIDGERRLNPNA